MSADAKFDRVKRSLEWAEIGVIVSIALSVVTFAFTLGVIYGDVQRNTKDIDEMKPLAERVAKIEAGVDFLVQEALKDQ